MFSYVGSHLFESIALLLTCGAGLSYAVGRSYLDGWAEVAGVPTLLFRADFYDTILAGVQLHRVWRTAAIVIVLAIAYFWAISAILDLWPGRIASVRRRRQWRDGWSHLRLRDRFAKAARTAGKGVPPHLRNGIAEISRWQVLDRRGKRRNESTRTKRSNGRPSMGTLYLVLTISFATLVTATYFLIQILLLKPASSDGARTAVKAYVAVTGHIPYQYEHERGDTSRHVLRAWACEGRHILSQYRTVTLVEDLTDGDGGGRESVSGQHPERPRRETYYVLQGVDKTFALLGKDGSVIRSFGDGPFSLRESRVRPISKLAQDCQGNE